MKAWKNCGGLDCGLLIIRVVVGGLIALHGAGILVGGQEAWTMVGTMGIGTMVPPHITGLIAGLLLLAGGVFVLLGMRWKLGTGALALVMLVATLAHIRLGHPVMGAGPSAWHAIDTLAVFLGLYYTGPGKYAVCKHCVEYTHGPCRGGAQQDTMQQQ